RFDIAKMLAGELSPTAALHIRDDYGAFFLVTDRQGGSARLIEHESFAYFHVTNVYDDGADVVLELTRFAQPFEVINKAMFDYRTGGVDYFANEQMRYRIGRSSVTGEPIADYLSAWPQLDWRRTGRRHQFSYHST